MNKTIGLTQGVALYVAAILGSGILFLSGVTATMAGPASIVSWFVVVAMNIPIAYTFAKLSQKFPDAGGAATFVRKAFGDHMGNLTGWFYFVCASVGQTIVSLTGAYYLGSALGFSEKGIAIIALCILFIAGFLNFFGLTISGKAAFVLSFCLLTLLVFTIIASIPKLHAASFVPFAPHGWMPVGSAVMVIFWSFFGWEAICNLAGQFKNPEKDIVKSTMISVLIIGGVFLSLSLVTIGTNTYGDEKSTLSPISVIMEDTLGIGAKLITAILAFIICTGTSNAFVASLSQLGYSLSRDGAFPVSLAKLTPRNQVPTRMIIFTVGFAMSGVLFTSVFHFTFQDILFIPTSLGILVYVVSMGAGMKLFKKRSRPWITSLISFILCLFVIPFFKLYVFVPFIVTIIYISYMSIKKCTNKRGKVSIDG